MQPITRSSQCLVMVLILTTFTNGQSPGTAASPRASIHTMPPAQVARTPTPLGLLLPRLNIGPAQLSAAGITQGEAQAAFVAMGDVAPVLVARLRVADHRVRARETARRQSEHRIRVGAGTPADCALVKQVDLVAIAARRDRDAILAEASAAFLSAVPATKRVELARRATTRVGGSLSTAVTNATPAPQGSVGVPRGQQTALAANPTAVVDPGVSAAWRQAILQAP